MARDEDHVCRMDNVSHITGMFYPTGDFSLRKVACRLNCQAQLYSLVVEQ